MIGLAFPKHEADRARLRALWRDLPPMPAIYEDGEDRRCALCPMILNVGPRVAASGVVVVCLECLVKVTGDDAVALTMVNLNNPNSKPEQPK